jgi:Peptidase family M28
MAVLAVAGCLRYSPPSPVDPAPEPFDGTAALAFVAGFALRDDGTPRYRIPGTEGQAEGAAYLWNATDLPGWQRSWHNLTGAEYRALDRRIVAGYTEPDERNDPPGGGFPRGCTSEEHAAVPGLPFSNLLVVRRAADPAAPLLLVGAHWDSQMHSDFDPDPAKRDLPDPGANDGASGVGVLLQLMRELEGRTLPFSVGLLFIDGEDGFYDCYPLAGSLHFAAHPPEPVAAFVLLDMVGDPGAKFPREGYGRSAAPGLQDLLWRHGQALAPQHFTGDVRSILDDHLSFIHHGVPSVDIIDAGRPSTFPPQWNTAGDTVDKLDAATLGLVGDVLLAALADPGLTELLDAYAS